MNKKVNTVLFVLGASAFNVVMMLVIFILVLAVLQLFLTEETSPAAVQLFMLLSFVVSIVGTYGLYTLLIKYITRHVDMDKYFHPIFRRKHKK